MNANAGIFVGPVFEAQPVEKMNGRAQAQAELDGQCHDAGELQPLAHQP